MTASDSNQAPKQGTKRRSIWRGLMLQIFPVVILPLAVLLIITTLAGLSLHQQSMRELAAERDARTVAIAAEALSDELEQRLRLLESLVTHIDPGASTSDMSDSLERAAITLDDPGTSLAYLDPQGNVLASFGEPALLVRIDRGTLASLVQGLAPGEAVYLLEPDKAQDPAALFALVSDPGGSLFSAAAVNPAVLIRKVLGGLVESGWSHGVLVVSADRRVLYQTGGGDPNVEAEDHPGVSQALQGKSGAIHFQAGREEHIAAYSRVDPVGWALVIEEPWEMIASGMLRLTENAPLVLLPIIVLALLALWFSSRYIVRPLQDLEAKAGELGKGNFEAVEESVGGIQEIRNLQGELVQMAHRVRLSQQGLRDYISAITQGQEDERRRLSRELHDDTLQSLIALNQRLQLVQMKIVSRTLPESQTEMLEQLQRLIEGTIQNLRRITRALRPAYLEELGLAAALEMLAKETEQGQLVKVKFQRSGAERRLKPETELALYRMAQEALNNVVKHSGAAHAWLQLDYSGEAVRLEVQDDGQGFDVARASATVAQQGHFGLLGLRERAEMIGANLAIDSEAGEGTQLRVSLPIIEAD
jgi:signal transduction histidine kinase